MKEFERRLRVSDLVIKFLTVRIDQTLKRLEKRKKRPRQAGAPQGHRGPAPRRRSRRWRSRCWAKPAAAE